VYECMIVSAAARLGMHGQQSMLGGGAGRLILGCVALGKQGGGKECGWACSWVLAQALLNKRAAPQKVFEEPLSAINGGCR